MPNQYKDVEKTNQLCVSRVYTGVARYCSNSDCVVDVEGAGRVDFANSLFGEGGAVWNVPQVAAHDTIFSINDVKIVVNHMRTREGAGEHQVSVKCRLKIALFSPDGQGGYGLDKCLMECCGFCTDDLNFTFECGKLPDVLCPTGSYVGYSMTFAGYHASVNDSYTFDAFFDYNVNA